MRRAIGVGLLLGAALMTALILHYDAHHIGRAVLSLGWNGFLAVVTAHAVVIVILGVSWWALGRGRADALAWRFIWARLMRESASEALPLSQIGGFVLGARAATISGVEGAFAAASTVVDVTAELVSQLAYTLLGLGLLASLRPDSDLVRPILAGVVAMSCLAGGFIALQARGAGAVERLAGRLAKAWLGGASGESGRVGREILALHGRPSRLAAGASGHFVAWLLNGAEAWLALRLLGVSVPLSAALVIDSLLYGLRSIAFMVPNAIGVQEGGYVMLGAIFGIGPDVALALSLVRRGRDLVIAVPTLAVWQVLEGRRAWRTTVAPEIAR